MRSLIALMLLLIGWPSLVHAQAHASFEGDGIVRIAVLDTGAKIPDSYEHASVRYFDARPGQEISEHEEGAYRSEHGTWVTNAILEQYDLPVEILSYRVEKSCVEEVRCEISTATLARAAVHASRQGADIIQISSYGRIDPALENALAELAAGGIHIVMCAGNEGGSSPLLPLARRNPSNIHIVGSLGRGDSRSFFSARDASRDEPLLRWRRGERVVSRTSTGRIKHVTGTSYAASLMTADLAREVGGSSAVLAVARPAPAPVDTDHEPAAMSAEDRVDTRVALAEGGEISVATLTDVERARLHSRAIRPEERMTEAVDPAPQLPTENEAAVGMQRTRSRALRPDKE